MIVTTNGCFDVLHLGHIHLLREASKHGELIVLLNSDNSVKRLKGKNRPIHNQEYRKAMLQAIRYVSNVIIFNEDTPNEALKLIQPMKHFKSKTGYKGFEKEVIESYGGEIILIDDLLGYSSTKEIEKIQWIKKD